MTKYKQILIFSMIMLVYALLVQAELYPETGTFENDYNIGNSIFNSDNNDSSVINLASLSNTQMQTPFVSDLDNDGVNEIYFFDGAALKIYNGQTRVLEGGLTLNFTATATSSIISYDIDGDGLTEIIIGSTTSTNENIVIIQHNSTTTIQNSFNYGSLDHTDGDMMLKCRGVQDCLMVFSRHNNEASGTGQLYAAYFNETEHGSATNFDSTSGSGAFCKPHIGTVAVANVNGAGNDDYIFTFGEIINIAGRLTQVGIYYASVTGTTVTEFNDGTVNTDIAGTSLPTTTNCASDDIRTYYTSPLVAELDASNSNLETVIGYVTDDTVGASDFQMSIYTASGGFIDDHPDVFNAEGMIVSNIIQAEVFDDGQGKDFCLLGYDEGVQEIDLLCGSETATTDDREYKYDVSGLFNVSTGVNIWNAISHAAQTDQDNAPSLDPGADPLARETSETSDEFITPYGVFRLSEVTYGGTLDSLDLIFSNPKPDSVFITADVQQNGFDDGIIMDSTNVWFLEDGFVNSPPAISSYTINPCLNSGAWKVNTSLSVELACTDTNSDSVTQLVTLYEGESSEVVSNSSFISSGTTFTHNFIVNKTTASSTLQLSCYDEENENNPTTTEFTYVVSTAGLEFDDCTTTFTLEEDEEVAAEETVGDTSLTGTDGLSVGINEFADTFNLTPFLIWLVIAGSIAFGIFHAMHTHPMAALGLTTIAEVFWLIVGTKLGMVPVSVIIIIILLVAVPIGIWVGAMATGRIGNRS